MAIASTATGLRVGEAAPDFSALKEHRGKTVVLYFYPKDHTPGCTAQACDFRDHYKLFLKKGAVVLGVSPDSSKSHEGFKAKQSLPFPLLADEDKSLCKAYGVWKEKSMYGRKFMGVERSTFVIGPDGRLKDIMRKISVPGHVEAVLRTL